MPETGVEKVEYRVFRAADVLVDRTPVFRRFFRNEGLKVLWLHVAEVIPARTSPLRHGVGFAFAP